MSACRQARREAGLCIKCGKDGKGGVYCPPCRVVAAQAMHDARERARRKRELDAVLLKRAETQAKAYAIQEERRRLGLGLSKDAFFPRMPKRIVEEA